MKALQSARFALWLSFLLVVVAGSVGCGEDDEDEPPTPPTLTIERVSLSGGAEWTPDDGGSPRLELGCAPEQLTVEVGPSDSAYMLGGWELRAAESCGNDESCGYLVLTVDGSEGSVEVRSARRFIELSSVELPGSGVLGVLVELVDDDGAPIEAESGPVLATLEVTVARAGDCDSSSTEPAD